MLVFPKCCCCGLSCKYGFQKDQSITFCGIFFDVVYPYASLKTKIGRLTKFGCFVKIKKEASNLFHENYSGQQYNK